MKLTSSEWSLMQCDKPKSNLHPSEDFQWRAFTVMFLTWRHVEERLGMQVLLLADWKEPSRFWRFVNFHELLILGSAGKVYQLQLFSESNAHWFAWLYGFVFVPWLESSARLLKVYASWNDYFWPLIALDWQQPLFLTSAWQVYYTTSRNMKKHSILVRNIKYIWRDLLPEQSFNIWQLIHTFLVWSRNSVVSAWF